MKKLADHGLHHLGFVVKDIEATVNQLKDIYGVKEFQIYDFEPGIAWSYGEESKNYKLKIAMGSIAGSDVKIEVIQPVSGEGLHKDFVGDGNGGLHHICFAVDEGYEDWVEYYRNLGYRFVFESETEDDVIGYRRCFYAEDPIAGMIFEVKENPYFRNKEGKQ